MNDRFRTPGGPRAGMGLGMGRFGTGEKAKPGGIAAMLKGIIRHARMEWRLLIVVYMSVIGVSLLEFAVPQITRYTIDELIPGGQFGQLFWIGAGVLGAAAALGLLRYVSATLMGSIGQRVLYKLRSDLYRHMQSLDVAFFDRNRTGDLMSRVTNDVGILQQLVSSGMMQLVTDVFVFTAIALYMLWIDWRLTLLLLATFPLMLVTTGWFGRRMRASFRVVQETVADVSDHLQNSLAGIRVIKAFASEEYEAGRFSGHAQKNMDANIKTVRLRAAYEPIIDFLNFVGLAIVLVFGAWLAMKKEMSIGVIVAFIAYLRLLQNPVRHFSRIINTVQQAAAAYERIVEILETKSVVVQKAGAVKLTSVRGHLSFRSVDFAYGKDAKVLSQFNLELAAGKITALVGPSGSGKTTVAHLIARFYDPQGGDITIDGHSLKDVDIASLRRRIGIVSQDVFLFNGSILDNIRYGNKDASEEELRAAARAANAEAFIEQFPNGYDTQIGERGVKLSGGQKQRISIARAILKNPQIILLDEATASLDTESEQHIQEALAMLLQGRTCLVIAHRLSTVRQADCIHVLERGRIIESGTHSELLRLGGRYSRLYSLQFPQPDAAYRQ